MEFDCIRNLYVNITKDKEGISYDNVDEKCYIDIKEENIENLSKLINLIVSSRKIFIFEDISIEINNKNSVLKIKDLSFLENLSNIIDNLHIEGIDLSKFDFTQLKNLKSLFLYNCNLQRLKPFIELEPTIRQCLYGNNFEKSEINTFSREIIKRSKKFIIDKKYYLLFNKKRIDFLDYLNMRNEFDFSVIEGLEITLPSDFDFTNEANINLLKNISNMKLGVNIEQYKLNQEIIDKVKIPLQIIIDNVSELSVDFVEKHDRISSVRMRNGSEQSKVPYSREVYIIVRRAIDEFLKEFDFNDTEINKAKKLYEKMIAEIDYNMFADELGQELVSRNLYGAMIDKTALCRWLCRNVS